MNELQGIVRFRFHEGQVEAFKRLSRQAMEIVRGQDTGTLQYETYFNADESEALVLERFRDSDALIEHGEHMAALMEPILATGTVSGELCGELSPALRALMTGDNPQLFTTLFMSL
ncbi:MAG: antibiotic biosynthesis monooxygenase [Dehalococcoidia bacterium]